MAVAGAASGALQVAAQHATLSLFDDAGVSSLDEQIIGTVKLWDVRTSCASQVVEQLHRKPAVRSDDWYNRVMNPSADTAQQENVARFLRRFRMSRARFEQVRTSNFNRSI